MSNFFAYMARMKYIKRWGLMKNSCEENIQEHSLQVAMVAHCLAAIGNRVFGKSYNSDRIAVLAMYHEASEVITGDLPTPIKYYNPDIKKAYKQIETIADAKLLSMVPAELSQEYAPLLRQEASDETRIVKYADKLCAYLKCTEELKSGNREFAQAKATIEKELKGYSSPEVDYFMKEFAGGFELTLDEMG